MRQGRPTSLVGRVYTTHVKPLESAENLLVPSKLTNPTHTTHTHGSSGIGLFTILTIGPKKHSQLALNAGSPPLLKILIKIL
jgi:hypothetical protein